MSNSLQLRRMCSEDVPNVAAIEFDTQISPWTLGIFHDCLRVGYENFVLELANRLIGFVVFQFVLEECHLLNIAISPDQQRQGFGRLLLQHTIQQAKQQGLHSVILEVRESNETARALYEKEGFLNIGRRRHYYIAGDGREDGLIYRRGLI